MRVILIFLLIFSFFDTKSQDLSANDLVQLYNKNRLEISRIAETRNFKFVFSDKHIVVYQNKADDSVLIFSFMPGSEGTRDIAYHITSKQVYSNFKSDITTKLKGKFISTDSGQRDNVSYQSHRFSINNGGFKNDIFISEASKNVTNDFSYLKFTFKYAFQIN